MSIETPRSAAEQASDIRENKGIQRFDKALTDLGVEAHGLTDEQLREFFRTESPAFKESNPKFFERLLKLSKEAKE